MQNRIDEFPWLEFVQRSGPDGDRWAREYRRHMDVVASAQNSITLLRRRDFERGEALLERARASLEAIGDDTQASVLYVIERWYYSALAYAFHAREAYDRADALMLRAGLRIGPAIEKSRCLMPLAMDWCELQFHRARVARESRNWPLMWTHVQAAASMRTGQIPLCTLSDGTEVGLKDVQRFYRSVAPPSAEHREIVETVLDDRLCSLHAERLMRLVLRLPGVVVAYP